MRLYPLREPFLNNNRETIDNSSEQRKRSEQSSHSISRPLGRERRQLHRASGALPLVLLSALPLQNLKKIRAEKGLSLEKVARLADLSLSTVVKVEDGTNQNPTIDTLKKIAKALEIGVDDLIQK